MNDTSQSESANAPQPGIELVSRALLDANLDACLLLDVDGTIIDLNEAMAQRLGGRPSELRGKSVYDHLPKEVGDHRRRLGKKVIKSGKPVRFVDERGGRVLDNRVIPVVGGGEVSRFAVVSRDITEERKREQEYREAERRYRTLVMQSPDTVIINDGGKIVFANNAARRLFGVKRIRDLIGRSAADFIDPADLPRVVERVRQVRKKGGKLSLLEGRSIRDDGSVVYVELTGSRIMWEGRIAIQIMGRDVTGRRQAESQLRLTQRAVDVAADALFWVTPDGRFDYVNAAACKMLGYARAALLRKTATSIKPGGGRGNPKQRWADHFARVRKAGSVTDEYLYQRKDGTTFPVEISDNYVVEPDGREYLFTFARDVSQRKESERLLREREKQLAHALRVSSMGEMVAAFAHQFGQPLNAVQNYARGYLNRLDGADPKKGDVVKLLTTVSDEVMRAGSIVRDIASFVRKSEIELVPTDTQDVVRAALQLVRADASEKGVELTSKFEKVLPQTSVDEILLEQALINVIRNGVDAASELKDARSRRVTVTVKLAKRGSVLAINVKNSGLEVDPNDVEQMFEPFYTNKPGGMGMGLAITRTIIEEAHEGRLEGSANSRGGMEFTISLPTHSAKRKVRRV